MTGDVAGPAASRPPPAQPPGLLQQASRSMFWNAALLPAVSALQLLSSVYLRRAMGLDSGVYDVAIGLVAAIVVYSGLGVSASIPQFVPGLRAEGAAAIRRFLARVWAARMIVLLIALVPVNLFAAEIAARFGLGIEGVLLVRLVSALAAVRAVIELGVRSLQALLAHLAANLVQMTQTLTAALAVIAALWLDGGVDMILVGLVGVGAAVALGGALAIGRGLRGVPAGPSSDEAAVGRGRFWRFALFMYAYDLCQMASMPAFVSPALAAVMADVGAVAIFNTAFQIPMMIVVVILAGFQGLYRPLFATVLAGNDIERLRTAFREVTKVQLVLLVPAGAGLLVLLGDLIPLLFSAEFAPAVPFARILCGFLFVESALNLGVIILSTDHHYGAVLAAQSLRVLTAPAFLVLAASGHLTAAIWCFAIGRLAAIAGAYVAARARYGLELPWAFAARVAAPTAIMAGLVALAQARLPASWPSMILLSVGGAAVFVLLARWWRLLGPREIDLLRRAGFPGSRQLLRCLVPPD